MAAKVAKYMLNTKHFGNIYHKFIGRSEIKRNFATDYLIQYSYAYTCYQSWLYINKDCRL